MRWNFAGRNARTRTWRLTRHQVRELFLPSSGKKKEWDCSYLSSHEWIQPLKTRMFEIRELGDEMILPTCLWRRTRSIGAVGRFGFRSSNSTGKSLLHKQSSFHTNVILKAYFSKSPSATVWNWILLPAMAYRCSSLPSVSVRRCYHAHALSYGRRIMLRSQVLSTHLPPPFAAGHPELLLLTHWAY